MAASKAEELLADYKVKGFHWHETYHVGQLDILRAMIMDRR